MIINMQKEIETFQGWIDSLYRDKDGNTKRSEWINQFYSFAEQMIELDPENENRRIDVADSMIIVAGQHFNRYCFFYSLFLEGLLELLLNELEAYELSPRQWVADVSHVPPAIIDEKLQEEFIVYALPLLSEDDWLNDHAATEELSMALLAAALHVARLHDFQYEKTYLGYLQWLKARAEKLASRTTIRFGSHLI